jgi:hypothetical protein
MVSRAIIRAEIRRFFTEPRSLIALPVLLLAAFVALWPHLPTWFTPVLMGVYIILEPSFNNILFRSPREFEGLAVAPVRWSTVVISKNCGSMILAVIVLFALSVPTAYMLPDPLTVSQLGEALELFLATLPAMLITGNLRSVQTPRRYAGTSLGDAAEAVITLVILGVATLPFLLLREISATWWAWLMYIAVTAALWLLHSVPATARAIQNHSTRLCLIE